MFMQQATGQPAASDFADHRQAASADMFGNEHGNLVAMQDINPATGADPAIKTPSQQKRGRPRSKNPGTISARKPPGPAGALPTALVAETGEVISNLQKQGVLKPPASDLPGGGPGHRTKNCRPVQINISETMFRQLKMIAATQSISIKDQIIAALLQQGYKG